MSMVVVASLLFVVAGSQMAAPDIVALGTCIAGSSATPSITVVGRAAASVTGDAPTTEHAVVVDVAQLFHVGR